MFTREENFVWNQAGLPTGIDVDQFHICMEETKEQRHIDLDSKFSTMPQEHFGERNEQAHSNSSQLK